ncbi:MAG: phytanoyl-CoA dioxygenase family protein [Planctomycetota bacterium]|nr:phytanoyl-CoA dioxygenase family protein [Planctomycetota bacterium]
MNENERYLFDLNGFLAVPNALNAREIASLNAQIDEHVESHGDRSASAYNFGNVLDWRGPMLNLIDHANILPYLDALLGPPPYPKPGMGPFYRLDHTYVTVIKPGAQNAGAFTLHGGGAPYDPGQYYHYRDGRMFNGLIVVAYNLTDVNEGDGGLGCVPGSHKANCRLPREWNDLRKPNPIARAVTGPAGTAVLFTEALTHGTLPWKGGHERRTVFFKYNTYCTAFGDRYLDEDAEDWAELSERQRALLERPNSRWGERRRGKALAH